MNVLIVGAGPTGMTLALALRRHGITCRLIDKLAARQPWSKALGVQTRTLEVMERFGLAGRFLTASQPVSGMNFHFAHGGLVKLDLAKVHPALPPLVILPQAETERILEEAGAAPERGVELVGVDAGTARLRHADGREETVTPDWLIGCDGAHSTMRQATGIHFAGKQYQEKLVLTDCSIEGLEPGRIHAFPGDARPGVYFPLPGGSWRAVAILQPDAPDVPENTLEPFFREGLSVHDPVWWSRFRISRRQAQKVRAGRMVLLGDAAHIHSPVGGQGMNLGIQDAFSLADALAKPDAEREWAVEHWAAERHRVARKVLRVTDFLTGMVAAKPSLLGSVLRRTGMGLVANSHRLNAMVTRAASGMDYPAIPP